MQKEAAGNEPVSFTHDRCHGNTCERVRSAEVLADWPIRALLSVRRLILEGKGGVGGGGSNQRWR